MRNQKSDGKRTTERFLDTVITLSGCSRHKKHRGDPCWTLEDSRGKTRFAICNYRAKNSGYQGKISADSFQRKSAKK